MPELSLYLADEDEKEFVSFVLNQGAWLIADTEYDSPRVERIYALERFSDSRRSSAHFFIQADSFDKLPAEFRPIHKKGKTLYYLSSRSGGPFISFFSTGTFVEERRLFVGTGSLSYYPSFWDPRNRIFEKTPSSLKDFYKLFVKHLKKKCLKIKPYPRFDQCYWLGKRAEELFKGGAQLVGVPQGFRLTG